MSTISIPRHHSYSIGRSSADYWGPRLALVIMVIWCAGFAIGLQASLAALTILGFLAAIAGVWRPFLGIAGVGMLCALDPLTRVYLMTGGLLRWNTFNYFLCVMLFYYGPIVLKRKDPHVRLMLLFFSLLAIESTLAPADWKSAVHVLLVVLAYFALLAHVIRGTQDDRAWYWLAIVIGSLTTAGGLAFYLMKSSLPYIDPNAMCYFPLTGVLATCLAFHVVRSNIRHQIQLSLLAAASGCWAFLTGSRGAMLVVAVAFTYLISEVRSTGRRVVLIAAAAIVSMGLLTQFSDLQDFAAGRVTKLLDSDRTLDKRTSGRYHLAMVAWNVFRDKPMGVGTGQFTRHYSEYDERIRLRGRTRASSPHSAWMKTLAENGVPGFVLFASFVLSFALVGWKKRRHRLFRLGLFATTCLGVAFVAQEFNAKGLWLLAAGVTVLLHRDQTHEPDRQEVQTQ